jgi:glycosyltransferase involved in cell wall biosynthesis
VKQKHQNVSFFTIVKWRKLGNLKKIKSTLGAYARWCGIAVKSCVGSQAKFAYKKERSVCLLAGTFPPNAGGGAFRPLSIAKYGEDFGWKINVICPPIPRVVNDAGLYLLSSLPKSVKIFRLPESASEASFRLLPKIDGGFINVLNTFAYSSRVFVHKRPTVIIASGPPFHNFVAGYYMARYFHAKLILDYRDEWTENPLLFVDAGCFDLWWEKRCLKLADIVFFVTKSQLENHIKAFPMLGSEKCKLVPNGWEPDDFNEINAGETPLKDADNGFDLLFVGRMTEYSVSENFLPCLNSVLERRGDLANRGMINLVGSSTIDISRFSSFFRNPEIIRIHGHVTKPLANRLMTEASVLLIFNGKQLSAWMPGKLYDYLAAGPPILVYGRGGEIASLVSRLNAGLIVPEGDSHALEDALDKLNQSDPLIWNNSKRKEWLKQHTRKVMVERMFNSIDQLF